MDTAAVIRQDALTEAYQSYNKLINKIVSDFYLRYGGDIEELEAQANFFFVRAFDTYDSTKSCFSTWLYIHLRNHLMKEYVKDLRYKMKNIELDSFEEDTFIMSPQELTLDWTDLKDSLSEDARCVVNIILDLPKAIQKMINHNRKVKGGNVRHAIRNYLKQEMEWTHQNINDTFAELETVQND